MSLIQLVYVSRSLVGATPDQWQPQLERIITCARDFNSKNSITGYLIFDGVEFVQILEGDESSVMGTFLRIASDRKHENVDVIDRSPIKERRFHDWTMGLAIRNDGLESVFRRNGFAQPGEMSQGSVAPVLQLAMQLSRYDHRNTAA